MQKYIGQTVEIIYLDQKGQFSKRRIEVRSFKNEIIKAFCLDRGEQRTFKVSNILAIQSVIKYAV